MKIRELFQRDITRRVNPVVKVEDHDEDEVRSELSEYVVTDQIARNFERLIDQHYLGSGAQDTSIWISGFFGSGKSLFLKLLCLVVARAQVGGEQVIDKLVDASHDKDFQRALKAVKAMKPALVVSMHMESEAFGDVTIVGMLWRSLHEAFGYSRTPWVAEMERSLEKGGLLDAFQSAVVDERGRPWSELRNDPLLKSAALSAALQAVDPKTYPDSRAADRAIGDSKEAANELQTPLRFTRRCLELLDEHPEYGRIFWGLDEMGQFAAGRADLLLELQSIVEQFSSQGKGRLWLAATAQEKLDDVVDNYSAIRDQVAKIRDRFPKGLRVELSQENAEEVVRERLLRKPSDKKQLLEAYLKPHEAWLLSEPTFKGLKRDYKPADLAGTVDSYPFLPAHFQMIADFMQGLARDTGGSADRTARGPRALIAITQDIARELGAEEIGALVRADHIYGHMQGSIPSEDISVVKDLDRAGGAPDQSESVLEATYVLDQIGVEQLPATAPNIYRSLIFQVGGAAAELTRDIKASLGFLVSKSFVREVGADESTTFRFLKAYQRKIEDDVRSQNPTVPEVQARTKIFVEQALKQIMPSSKATYAGARVFTLGVAIDDEFLPAGSDISVNIYSPLKRHAPDDDARARSVSAHQVYWIPAESNRYLDEVRLAVATQAVLSLRSAKATTDEERSQIKRAQEDLNSREARILSKTTEALKRGVIYIDGAEVSVSAKPGETIVERVVESQYPALARAPVPVDETDLDQVFQSRKGQQGALAALGLLANDKLVDSGAIARDVMEAVDILQYKPGGASGELLIKELQKSPKGYSDMQTRLATSVLCALGSLKAIAYGGTTLSLDKGLQKALRVTSDFRKLTFEREAAVDPIDLKAVSDLLQQRFDRKVGYEVPLVAQAARDEAQKLTAKIERIEASLRDDVPQASGKLQPLLDAAKKIEKANSDSAVIQATVAVLKTLETWSVVLKPISDQLDAEAVRVIGAARILAKSTAVLSLFPEKAQELSNTLNGPEPWQDLKLIRNLYGEIGARVKAESTLLHTKLDEAVDQMKQTILERGGAAGIEEARIAKALQEVEKLRCSKSDPSDVGICRTCGSSLEHLEARVDASVKRLDDILLELLTKTQADLPTSGTGSPSAAPNPSPKAPKRVSVSAMMNLPFIVSSHAEIEDLVLDFRDQLTNAVTESGPTFLVS